MSARMADPRDFARVVFSVAGADYQSDAGDDEDEEIPDSADPLPPRGLFHSCHLPRDLDSAMRSLESANTAPVTFPTVELKRTLRDLLSVETGLEPSLALLPWNLPFPGPTALLARVRAHPKTLFHAFPIYTFVYE